MPPPAKKPCFDANFLVEYVSDEDHAPVATLRPFQSTVAGVRSFFSTFLHGSQPLPSEVTPPITEFVDLEPSPSVPQPCDGDVALPPLTAPVCGTKRAADDICDDDDTVTSFGSSKTIVRCDSFNFADDLLDIWSTTDFDKNEECDDAAGK